ncbi:MAG: hypothetical protein WD898_01665 [Candidatus Paceibacterota bacterium]
MEKEKQLPLLSDSETKRLYGGPVFEAGPGWGNRLGKWLKKILARPALPPIAIMLLLVGLFLIFRPNKTQDVRDTKMLSTITETVVRGDSYALIARRAISSYLANAPEHELTNGQRLFIEENIRRRVEDQTLAVGSKVVFTTMELEKVIDDAKRLRQSTLQKWEELSRKAKFQ